MERQEGFYWVKLIGGRWVVAEWRDEHFYLTGISMQFYAHEVAEINETRIVNNSI